MQRPPRPPGPPAPLARLLLLLGGLALAATGCAEDDPTSPSLLLLTTGGLRADALPCVAPPEASAAGRERPAAAPGAVPGRDLCSIGAAGATFVWAFSELPAGAPAAASLLTGLPPADHGVSAAPASFLRTGTPTLATRLAARGYASAAFVADAGLNRARNFQPGFERYEVSGADAGGSIAAADAVTHRAVEWLRTRGRRERPWLLWVHWPAVEATPAALPTPSPADTAAGASAFDLARLDAAAARVIEAARSPADDAARGSGPGIAFAALRGAPERRSGPALDPAVVRVPLLWQPPGGTAPRRITTPVSLRSLAPTALRAAAVSGGESLPGGALELGDAARSAPSSASPIDLTAPDASALGVVTARRFVRLDLLAPPSSQLQAGVLHASGRLPTLAPLPPRVAWDGELAAAVARLRERLAHAARPRAGSPAPGPGPDAGPAAGSGPGAPAATAAEPNGS